jgi:hypothetical protein
MIDEVVVGELDAELLDRAADVLRAEAILVDRGTIVRAARAVVLLAAADGADVGYVAEGAFSGESVRVRCWCGFEGLGGGAGSGDRAEGGLA